MNTIEFRAFFDSLPDDKENLAAGKGSLTKLTFARECAKPIPYLNELASGKRRLKQEAISNILPVMRKYGFIDNIT